MPAFRFLQPCLLFAALALAACGPASQDLYTGDLPERVDFNFHVKPILSDRCFACHGPDANARKADLRLDTEEGARSVIRPGSLRRSELFRRIASDDAEQVMPPRDSHLELSDYEVAVLARWIEQGAEWKPHWSFIPPALPEPPRVENAGWTRGPIDRFVLARLEREGLSPSPEADRERLLRRVAYDLTGLPPSVQEVDAFLADSSPDAYERAVDRLLASPAYGERMATLWLDVARYADSHGYQDDGIRHMWRWRDWVIRAFNENQPYDRFVTWQLAGDLLPDATRDQILATGFNRNHPQSAEGGIVDEEFRVEYVADRTSTFGRGLLGLSMDCARCHDHKYDPVSQKDFYRLFAFFNNVNEIGMVMIDGNAEPTLLLPDDTTEARLAELRREIAAEERALREHVDRVRADPATAPKLRGLRPTLREGLVGHFPLDSIEDEEVANLSDPERRGRVRGEPQIVPGRQGGALEVRDLGVVQVGGAYAFDRPDPFSLSVWVYPTQTQAYAPLVARVTGFERANQGYELSLLDGRVSASLVHRKPSDALRVTTRAALPLNTWSHLVMTYDGSGRASGLRIYVDGQAAPVAVEADGLRRGIAQYNPSLQIGGRQATDSGFFDKGRVDEVRVYDRAVTPLEAAALAGRDALDEADRTPPERWSEAQRESLLAYHLQTRDAEYRRRSASLRQLRAEENRLVSGVEDVMVMREMPQPRPTHLLSRGAYDAPAEQVQPGTPGSVLAFPDSLPPNRLGLARWMFSPENPLTARVAVNRYWQMFFGTGLVATADDFGNQGELPSHPELLDWLAVTYRESGWDTRALLRTIVLSATYRQSSRATPRLLERDPENRLLARGPSHRLPAEMVRDGALAASGLLVREVGGPSVKPYQPEGLWEEKSAGRGALARYEQGHGDDLYRRTLYTFWKRSSPHPTLTTFDAADRDVCTARRERTNTPLQALVLMNDPQMVEAARLLAERMLREGGGEPEARLRLGFRAVTSRAPSARELAILGSLYRKELDGFRAEPARAGRLLAVGEHPRDPRLDPTEVAAYTVVASAMLNLDEAVSKR